MERQRFLEVGTHSDLTGVVEAHVKRLADLRDRPETWELQVDREGFERAHRRRSYLSPGELIVSGNEPQQEQKTEAVELPKPIAVLRASLRKMMDIRASMNQQAGSGQWSGSFRDDPLFDVAKEAYTVLRTTDAFTEYADEFWGPHMTDQQPGHFGTAYSLETNDLNTDGRRGYLERRIELLKRIIRETAGPPQTAGAPSAAPPVVEARSLRVLHQRIEEGRAVDTNERLDPQSGLPPVFGGDPLKEWAKAAFRFLREYRYDDAARDFKGADDSVPFDRAFKNETQELGREGYRNRCVRILEELLAAQQASRRGELPSAEGRASDELRDEWRRGDRIMEDFFQAAYPADATAETATEIWEATDEALTWAARDVEGMLRAQAPEWVPEWQAAGYAIPPEPEPSDVTVADVEALLAARVPLLAKIIRALDGQ